MIDVQNKPDAFEDAIEATVYMATVHVREGELALPERIRAHLADGPVIVHLVRGERDVAVHEATLTSRSTLTGITWPADVKPRTSLTVLCPRGGASHDIGVLLPELNVDWPDDDLPAAEPGEAETAAEPEPEPADDVKPTITTDTAAIEGVIAEALAAVAEHELPAAESVLPGPAEYTTPADLPVHGELPVPADRWPGVDDLAAGETTEVLTTVLVPAAPDPTEGDVEPGTVFSAALVAVRSQALIARQQPPRRAGWLERRVREAARLVLDESYTATRLVVAGVSFLVLAGTGVGFLLSVVAR